MGDEMERCQLDPLDRRGIVLQPDLPALHPVETEETRVAMNELARFPAAGRGQPVDLDHGKALAERIENILDEISESVMTGDVCFDGLGDLAVGRAVRCRLDTRPDAGHHPLARSQHREIMRVALFHLLGKDQEVVETALVGRAQDRRKPEGRQPGRDRTGPCLADTGDARFCLQPLQLLHLHRPAILIEQRHQNSPLPAPKPPVRPKSRSGSRLGMTGRYS